jgi:hypothetical protein
MECKVKQRYSKGGEPELKKRIKMVNKVSRVFSVREHDPIWLRFVVKTTGVRSAQVRRDRVRENTRGKRGEGMKSKINNSWLPLPTTTSSSTRGASERGTRARNSCRQARITMVTIPQTYTKAEPHLSDCSNSAIRLPPSSFTLLHPDVVENKQKRK